MNKFRGLLLASTATRNPLPSRALASTTATSGLSDNQPVLAQRGLPTSKQGALLSTKNVLPECGFSLRTPYVQLERYVGEPSLYRGRVPKPMCSISRTDVPVQWQFLS